MMGYVVGVSEGNGFAEGEKFEDPNNRNLVKEVSIEV